MTTTPKWMTTLAVCGLMMAGYRTLAADTDTVGKIDMVSINKMQVTEVDDTYLVEVELTFQNKNPDAVKLRNATFESVVESKEKGRETCIDIGSGLVDELEIPGASNKRTPGSKVKSVTIKVGPKNSETTAKVIRLWNVLGNPAASMTMVLKGKAEIGVHLPKGWIFEQGKSYEVELRFVPTVQRKVLFI